MSKCELLKVEVEQLRGRVAALEEEIERFKAAVLQAQAGTMQSVGNIAEVMRHINQRLTLISAQGSQDGLPH